MANSIKFIMKMESEVLMQNQIKLRFNDLNFNPETDYEQDPSAKSIIWKKSIYPAYNDWIMTCNASNWSKLLSNLKAEFSIIDSGDLNAVNDMSGMFNGCENLNSVSISFNTSNVTNMQAMFAECYKLTTIPLFDTSNVTNMEAMFADCTNLSYVPLLDTSNVTNMSGMFMNCSNLKTMYYFDTSKVTNMEAMFYGCNALTNIERYNTSNVTNMAYMFNGCESIKELPTFDTSKALHIDYICANCTNLILVPLFNTDSVTSANSAFENCINVKTGALKLYNQMKTRESDISQHNDTFKDCGKDTVLGLSELMEIPIEWGGLATNIEKI